MRRALPALGLVILVACGPGPASPSGSSTPAGDVDALLGDWTWIRSCDAVVEAFEEAGLTDRLPRALVDARYFANEDQIRRGDPCAGAEETGYLYFLRGPGPLGRDRRRRRARRRSHLRGRRRRHGRLRRRPCRPSGRRRHVSFEVRRPATCDAASMGTYVWALATFAPATLERAA